MQSQGTLAASAWTRWVGYLWLMIFMVCSTPALAYPNIRKGKREPKDAILPLSVIKLLLVTLRRKGRGLKGYSSKILLYLMTGEEAVT